MTLILSVDPGGNTGVALGFYDSTTPYRLVERWQVHGGLDGFIRWIEHECPDYDEVVVERFIFSPDEAADFVGVPIEGVVAWDAHRRRARVFWQDRRNKGDLIGYSAGATTKVKRQRERFDFLDRFGMFRAGTENDDSNDAIVHAIVNLKARRHMPTMRAFWPGRSRP